MSQHRILPLLLLSLALGGPARGDTDPGAETAEAAPFGVRLDEAARRLAALEIRPAPRPHPAPAVTVRAEALDPTPLAEAAVTWQQRHRAITAARQRVRILERRYRRLQRLHDNVRRRDRDQAELDWRSARAELASLRLAQAAQRRRLRLRWGATVAGWIEHRAPELDAVLRHRHTLVRLVPAATVARFRYRGRDQRLTPVSRLPGVDPLSGREASLHLAPVPLPFGLRFSAAAGSTEAAIPIPDSAVVWQGGQGWFYVRIDDDTFRRRPVRGRRIGRRWWIEAGLKPGEAVVTGGAQWLLAQELRALVPEEDDD